MGYTTTDIVLTAVICGSAVAIVVGAIIIDLVKAVKHKPHRFHKKK